MITPRTAVDSARSRLSGEDHERGSLPFLFLVMVLTVALGGVILATVTAQARTSRFNEDRVRSLDAAQGGLDHALSQMRTAVATLDQTAGNAGALPCFREFPWTNLGPAGTTQFRIVSVDYYRTNPSTMTAATRSSKKMTCSDQAGTFDRDTNSRAPRFALIRSEGRDTSRSDAPETRTLEQTYEFQTNDVNITGGQIRIYPSASSKSPFCMDAGSGNPTVGTPVLLQTCSTTIPPSEQQVFAYRSDLSIELVSSIPNPGVAGLCLDSDSATPTAGAGIVLKRCGAPDANPQKPDDPAVCPAGSTPESFKEKNKATGRTCVVSPASQRWSVDDNAHLRGANTGATDVSGLCVDVATQTGGTQLRLQSCAGGTTDPRQVWVPSPTAGAGAAGAGNNQIVNYAQFATCIDITGGNTGASYEILYTCKQNPNADNVLWNQKLRPSPALEQKPSVTLLTVSPNGTTRYCLKTAATEGGYPTLQLCPLDAVATDNLKWTVSGRYTTNAANSTELPYADRYTIKDSAGRCLAPGNNSDLHDGAYYKLVVATCDGSTAQKWNADASRLKSSLSNLREID